MEKGNLAKNTTYYTAALTVQKILAFIYFWFISNSLFPNQLGQYVFALSFTTMFSIFIDLGLSPILTRDAAKDKTSANNFLRNVLGLKIPLAVITFIAAWVVINLTGKPAEVKLLVYLSSLIMVLDSFSLTFWVIFRSRQVLKYESLTTIVVQILIFTLGMISIKLSGEIKYLIMALLTASIFNFFVSLLLLKYKLNFSLWPKLDRPTINHFIKIMPAFALAGIFVKIYNTSDAVLLSFLAGDQAVGYFAVPAKVVFALQQIIPAAFAAVIFPAFSYYYATSKEKLQTSFEKSMVYLMIVSLPITAGLLILIPEIIHLIWPKYTEVIPTFYIMTLAIPFIFLAFPTGHLLNACDRQKITTVNRIFITILAVILNVLLIPSLTFFGAGLTFFITNFVLLFLDLLGVRSVIKINYRQLGLLTGKVLVATAIMALIVGLLKSQIHLLIIVPIGMIIYFSLLLMFKGVDPEDLKLLRPKR